MGFLNSDEVKVYPSTRRGTNQFDARPITEYQLVSLVNRLVGNVNGFVITQPENFLYGSRQELEFNIHGYYFKVDADTLIQEHNTGSKIYAHIWLDNVTKLVELYGEDDSQYGYSGIYFSNSSTRPETLPDGTTRKDLEYYNLLLLEKDVFSVWGIPQESQARFSEDTMPTVTPTHLSIDIVDGGEFEVPES